MRSDILEVLVMARDLFPGVGLVTNGTLFANFSQNKLHQLHELAKAITIQVSIDSIDSKQNNVVRGQTMQVLDGLDILERNQIPFSVGIVLTKVNVPCLSETLNFLISKYVYLKGFNLMNVMPELGKWKEYLALRVPLEHYFAVIDEIKKLKEELRRPDIYIPPSEVPSLEVMFDQSGFRTCVAGLFKMHVMPDGSVNPCDLIRQVIFGNLYTDSWRDIYSRFLSWFFSLQEKAKGPQCLYFNRGKDRHLTGQLIPSLESSRISGISC